MVHPTKSWVFESWRLAAAFVVLLALGLSGCAASHYKAGDASAPESPMAAERETAADTEDSGEEADATSLYASARADAPVPMRGGVAQATPPAKAVGPQKEAGKKTDAPPPAEHSEPPGVATGSAGKPAVVAPMLIYKAHLFMAVFETKKSIDAVEKMAKDVGGYLVSREDNRITVRVPSSRFDGALDQITKLGDMLHRNVNVQDVTSEYFDLQIRLRNLEVMRDRFEELLKKAAKVEEALAVERELERVAGEIERLKGRLKLLRELVTFSTITVEFQPRPTDHVDNKVRLPFPWLDRLGLGDLLRL